MSMTITDGQLAAIRAEVQANYYERAVLGPTFMDTTDLLAPGALSYTFPVFSKGTVQDKVKGTAFTNTTMTLSGDTLLLNKHKGLYTTVEDVDEIQTVPNLGAAVVREFAKAWVEQFESDLWTEAKNTSAAAPDHILQLGTAGTLIDQSNILDGNKLLNDQKLPKFDRFLAVSTAQERAMLAIGDFVKADSYGNAGGLINGEIGKVYGYRVIVSTSAAAAEALMYHRDHTAYAIQRLPKFETDRDVKNQSDEYALSLHYGMKALRGGIYGVQFNATGA